MTVDPDPDLRFDIARAEPVGGLDIDHRWQIVGLRGADLRQQQVGLRERVLSRPEELVGTAEDPVVVRALPVGGELRILVGQAIRDPDERELDAVVRDLRPVDRALVVGYVHTFDGLAASTHGGCGFERGRVIRRLVDAASDDEQKDAAPQHALHGPKQRARTRPRPRRSPCGELCKLATSQM